MLGPLRAVSKSATRVAAGQCERSMGSLVSMTEDFPGLPATTSVAPGSGKVQLSVLSNGIKVATRDDAGGASTVSFKVNAGSRYEQVPGTASFLSHLAFKRTQKRSSAKVAYDIESFGGKFSAKSCREGIVYTGTGLRDSVGSVVETLAECISQPMLRGWEVQEEKAAMQPKLDAWSSCKFTQAGEEVFGAAFGRASPLGHYSAATSYGLGSIDENVLRGHLGAFFTAGNIVVSGVNVDHQKLVELIDAHVSGVPTVAAPAAPASSYEGGYSEQRKDGDAVTLAVGFPTAGLAKSGPVSVLTSLLGFGRDLYAQNLINAALAKPENGFVKYLNTTYKPYSDVGLLYFTGATSAKNSEKLLALIANIAKAAANASDDAVAKATVKAQVQYSLAAQARETATSVIAKRVAAGVAADDESVLGSLKAVSAADVKKAAQDAFSKPVSIGAIGNTVYVPNYNKASKLFQ